MFGKKKDKKEEKEKTPLGPPLRNYPKGTISTQYNFMLPNDIDDWIVSEQKRRGLEKKAHALKQILREAMIAQLSKPRLV